jgi:hypothetical protein
MYGKLLSRQLPVLAAQGLNGGQLVPAFLLKHGKEAIFDAGGQS